MNLEPRFARLLRVGACGALLLAAAAARAQAGYPEHTVRIISPVQAGSATDLVARLLADKLTTLWGQQVLIDNRPGVNGLIGTDVGAHALPDGYTLTIGNSGTHVINPGLYKKLSYDPVRDFAAVAEVVTSPLMLVAPTAFPPKTIAEVLPYARAHSINFASPGATGQLSGLLFNSLAKLEIVTIPYKGSNAAEVALLQGDAQLLFSSIAGAQPYINSGRMRVLGVTSLKRLPFYPDIPTLDESGLKGYEIDYWIGLFAPAATPKPLVVKINADLAKILAGAEMAERLQKLGYLPVGAPPAEFAGHVRTSVAKYGKMMRELGIEQE
jgi:tripartite-type tricarboxylate transporter receptor subunit TctC